MSELTLAFYLISIAANFLLGFFVLLRNTKEKINSTFFTLVLSVIGWQISLLFFYIVESPGIILWVGRFNFAIVLIMLFYLLKFSLIFPSETFKISKKLFLTVSLWIMIFFVLTLFTPLVDKTEIIIGPAKRETVYGILYPLYILHYIVFAGGGVFLIFQKLKVIKNKLERYQLIYFLTGLSLALFFGFITNLLLPLFGIQQAAYFGPLATIVFSGITTYAILKHHLFDIKVLATEFFVGILGIILLAEVILSSSVLKMISLFAFLLFLLFGYFLIKSVIREIEQKEKLAALNEKLRIAYQEVEKLSKAKSEFISIASHQIRTPLTAIKGYISMILEGSYGKLADRVETPLENVYKANERLINLVNDLLSISRIESGKMKLEPEKSSIEEMIMGVIDDLKITAEKKNLYLKLEKPAQPLPKIMLDKDKMRQAILNLVDNAIKYTQKGGITINIKIIDSKLQILIRDTGGGMSKEEIVKLFESFSRGIVGSQSYTKGTGLGLYIARRFVEMHHGKIWAESDGIGKGSTFYIELPIN